MADFFKNLEKHIEDGWDDIKNAVKDSAADLKEGAQALDGRVDATPVMKAEEAEAGNLPVLRRWQCWQAAQSLCILPQWKLSVRKEKERSAVTRD